MLGALSGHVCSYATIWVSLKMGYRVSLKIPPQFSCFIILFPSTFVIHIHKWAKHGVYYTILYYVILCILVYSILRHGQNCVMQVLSYLAASATDDYSSDCSAGFHASTINRRKSGGIFDVTQRLVENRRKSKSGKKPNLLNRERTNTYSSQHSFSWSSKKCGETKNHGGGWMAIVHNEELIGGTEAMPPRRPQFERPEMCMFTGKKLVTTEADVGSTVLSLDGGATLASGRTCNSRMELGQYLYIWAIVKTLGSRKGHPQIWKGPIAYHTFVQ